MREAVEIYKLPRGRILTIYPDSDYPNPRKEWDGHLTTIFHWHRRYDLGTEISTDDTMERMHAKAVESLLVASSMKLAEFGDLSIAIENMEELYERSYVSSEYMEKQKNRLARITANYAFILPLYIYDHSGITISTEAFSCPWDSGQCGFVVMLKKDFAENYSATFKGRWTAKQVKKAEEVMKGEVKLFDDYLTGEVYGYTIDDKEGAEEDSCWGFYGYDIRDNGVLYHLDAKDVSYLYRTKQLSRKSKKEKYRDALR